MAYQEIRILDIEDITVSKRKMFRIMYYDQQESPHVVYITRYVSKTVCDQLQIGQTFTNFHELELFLNQK